MHSRPSSVRVICSPLTTAMTCSVLAAGGAALVDAAGIVIVGVLAADLGLSLDAAAAGTTPDGRVPLAGLASRPACSVVPVRDGAGLVRMGGACAAAWRDPARRIKTPMQTTTSRVAMVVN